MENGSINNVGRTFIIRIATKTNGGPVRYITLLTLISPPNRGHKHLCRLICGPLAMANLAVPLIGANDTGKVRNRNVAKLHIVFLNILLINSFSYSSSCQNLCTQITQSY